MGDEVPVIETRVLKCDFVTTKFAGPLRRVSESTGEHILDAWAFRILLATLAALCIFHVLYFRFSRMVPSTDEAHYMSGALSIADGLRTGTLSGAWTGYLNALWFKPPLVCVPAGIFMLLTGSLTLPFSLSLVLTFAVLGLASYSLFRNCLEPFHAATAALVLVSTPMITGLTHRYYVESMLLVIIMASIDLIVRGGWRSLRRSIGIGLLFGLGLLSKTTFPVLMAVPVAASLVLEVWERRRIRAGIQVVAHAALAGAVGVAVAAPWYVKNLPAVLGHSRLAASSDCCFYSNWLAADLSAGPSILLTVMTAAALPFVLRGFFRHPESRRSVRGWTMVSTLGLATLTAVAATPNKSTRFFVTALPAFAMVAVAGWRLTGKWSRPGAAALAAAMILLSLHNSFDILPFGTLRAGDVQFLDDRFPLNIPKWFDDNHPADGRDYRLAEAEARIAADVPSRFGPGYKAEARTVQLGLLINHDYFEFLSTARKHPVRYTWWPGSTATGAGAPDYILSVKGFAGFYPGVHFFEYYPRLEEDVAAARLPYEPLAALDVSGGGRVLIFARKLRASLATAPAPGAILLEAEQPDRGNVTVDRGEYGYGRGIGVIVTLRPAAYAEYDFNAAVSGEYQLELRYASGSPRPLRVLLDGRLISEAAAARATGGYLPAHQAWVPVDTVNLKAGRHTLTLETQSLFPHVDRILLAPSNSR